MNKRKIAEIDDVELWNKVREGDKDALSELFERYHQPMLHFGMKLHQDEALVQDCAQDIFSEILNISILPEYHTTPYWISEEKVKEKHWQKNLILL